MFQPKLGASDISYSLNSRKLLYSTSFWSSGWWDDPSKTLHVMTQQPFNTTAECSAPDSWLQTLLEFGKHLPPLLLSLLFRLSLTLSFHWHQKSPTFWSSHLRVCGNTNRVTWGGKGLSAGAEIFSRVLYPDFDFLLGKQLWTLWQLWILNVRRIKCLKWMCCLDVKTRKHKTERSHMVDTAGPKARRGLKTFPLEAAGLKEYPLGQGPKLLIYVNVSLLILWLARGLVSLVTHESYSSHVLRVP